MTQLIDHPGAYGALVLGTAPASVATLAELAQRGQHAQIRPTIAGAHLAAVTDPQHLALHVAAVAGRVTRGGGPGQSPVRVLTALARKGLLVLTAHPGPRRSNWAYGEITDAGRRELARLNTPK